MKQKYLSHKTPLVARLGLTLVELLIVISILVLLTAIAIPSVRVINKDRKIREGAREVNSILSSSRDSALVNGFAGVEFVRNTNFVDSDGVNYAVTSMYRVKVPRVYAGDSIYDRVIRIGPGVGLFRCVIPAPLINPNIIQPNDYLRLDYRGVLYRILSVGGGGGTLMLVCEVANNQPMPAAIDFSAIPDRGPGYQIIRQPVRDERSRVDLPRGLYIDLRLSGPIDSPTAGGLDGNTNTNTLLGLDGPAVQQSRSVVVLFDSTGAIDRVYPNGLSGGGTVAHPFFRPSAPLYFLVAADRTGNAPVGDNLLNNDNLWVKCDQRTGTTAVSSAVEMTASDASDIDVNRIRNSRGISQAGQTARQ